MSAATQTERQALRVMSEALRIRPAWGSGSGLCWEATRRGIPKPSPTRWVVGSGLTRCQTRASRPLPTRFRSKVGGLDCRVCLPSRPQTPRSLSLSGEYRGGDVMPQKIPGGLGAEPPKTSRGRRSRDHKSEGRVPASKLPTRPAENAPEIPARKSTGG